LSSDPNRPRPRSSKKRRAVQTGGNPPTGGSRPARPSTQRAKAGGTRGGSASSGIPTAWWAIGAVVLFAIGVALAGGVIKFGSGASANPSGAATNPSNEPASGAPAGSPVARGTNCPTTEPPAATTTQTAVVSIETAKGTIEITVDPALGPKAAGNFIALASCGFYDGVVFHRLVPDFVIQGGDPTRTGGGGPGYEFADDAVAVPYVRGIVAMANSGPNTNGSQFFVVLADNNGLKPLYSVFGRVTAGMDVVDAIAAMPNSGPPNNQATSPVAMDKVTVGQPSSSGRPASASPASASPASPNPS
jgi:peptidyl-prolyl cis-trans isomerase B (cyclophilin B)